MSLIDNSYPDDFIECQPFNSLVYFPRVAASLMGRRNAPYSLPDAEICFTAELTQKTQVPIIYSYLNEANNSFPQSKSL